MMCNTETTPKEGEIDSEKIFFPPPRETEASRPIPPRSL